MLTLTLLTKAHHDSQLKLIQGFLTSSLRDLDCRSQIAGKTPDGWVRVTLSGEDENVARAFLEKQVGLAPPSFSSIRCFSSMKGFLMHLSQSREFISVDLGIRTPNRIEAAIPLEFLQAELADGRKIALQKIVELYGLCNDLSIFVKISHMEGDERVEATLSDVQISRYASWCRSLLDRLLILGASFDEINSVLKVTGSDRDVASVESLGLLEHAVVCKLGTDAAGLIPKIGRRLPNASFAIHSPRRLYAFFGDAFDP